MLDHFASKATRFKPEESLLLRSLLMVQQSLD
jgi:hypothetical protein